ncbi:tetratricopeptide repeat protein [Pikeienuella piscinae]|uniref:Tetratricopeptide repeat protein n=1 Tax=Pikeienuella piscinae TaxID=2748098 RepID=A0A7L5BXB1_9RHOB|nr:tetratricopeptide repeat protein [Pikeienuella piscinae]QIE54886.1 tetratricopeptide repeat protein [Pikeienuella piscinae]
MRRAAALVAVLLFGGCGGSPTPAPPTPASDKQIESTLSLARFAFCEGRYDRAEEIYGRALERARERDDPDAIALVSYELSAARLRLGDAKGALGIAERASDQLGDDAAAADA